MRWSMVRKVASISMNTSGMAHSEWAIITSSRDP